jgi:hypothetical protein
LDKEQKPAATNRKKDKNLHKTDWAGNIGCLAIIILFVVWGAIIYNGIHRSITDKTLDLRAEAVYKNGIVTLTNQESEDWKYVWLSLDTDGDPDTYEYNYYITEIESHATIDIDLAEFKKNNLYNFDPVTMEPRILLISGSLGMSTGRFYYKFE